MFTHNNYFVIFILTLCSFCTYGYVDYMDNTDLIQQRVGYDIKLHCDLKGLIDDAKLKDVQIHWFFKQCGESYINVNNCNENYENDWTELPCENSFCKPDLILRNVTEKYSGLYKCTVYPYGRGLNTEHTPDIRLVRTYQLEVRNSTMDIPQFLDYNPMNTSVAVGTQIVFQCRVRSEVHPTIKWFRRIPEIRKNGYEKFGHDNFNSHIVRYNGQKYELLSTAHEKYISDRTYLSKLIINNVRWQDEGQYACVAVNYHGHRIRLFYLTVLANTDETDYFSNYDEEYIRTDPSEFWILFLMPLSLAMLPISVWLFYRIYKNRINSKNLKRQKIQYLRGEDQIQPEIQNILIT